MPLLKKSFLILFLRVIKGHQTHRKVALQKRRTLLKLSIDDSLGWSLGWGIERRGNGMLFWQWGENEGIKTLAAGSRSTGTAVVVLTNGQWGHDVGRPIMELVLGKARFLDFRMVNYRP